MSTMARHTFYSTGQVAMLALSTDKNPQPHTGFKGFYNFVDSSKSFISRFRQFLPWLQPTTVFCWVICWFKTQLLCVLLCYHISLTKTEVLLCLEHIIYNLWNDWWLPVTACFVCTLQTCAIFSIAFTVATTHNLITWLLLCSKENIHLKEETTATSQGKTKTTWREWQSTLQLSYQTFSQCDDGNIKQQWEWRRWEWFIQLMGWWFFWVHLCNKCEKLK